jgi:hypothetical protein
MVVGIWYRYHGNDTISENIKIVNKFGELNKCQKESENRYPYDPGIYTCDAVKKDRLFYQHTALHLSALSHKRIYFLPRRRLPHHGESARGSQ